MTALEGCLETLRRHGVASGAELDTGAARIALVLESPPGNHALWTAAALANRWLSARERARIVAGGAASGWPFSLSLVPGVGSPAIVWVPHVHEAFVNRQTAGTRLVTTQAAYLVAAWLEEIGGRDVLLLATADPNDLRTHAPEVLARRGPFREALIVPAGAAPEGRPAPQTDAATAVRPDGPAGRLAAAFRSSNPAERLELCVRALEHGRTPAALVATASVCMEVSDLDAAARDLDDALALAPDWAAAHFERGKLWLRLDDMERASVSFRAAAERLPHFSSAWANLGATLGELDRAAEALAAFEQALAADPLNHQALNNIGVVNRELGRLPESEAAFRRVIALAPELAVGHYNLGHTLFLQGRFQMALSAYAEGQKRDLERNPVQASRLALCRLACGDPRGALADLQRVTAPLPSAYKQQLLADTTAVAWALLTERPDLPGWTDVQQWLTAELARLR